MRFERFPSNEKLDRDLRFNSEIVAPYVEGIIKPIEFIKAGVFPYSEVDSDSRKIYDIKHSDDYIRDQSQEAQALEYGVLKLFNDGLISDGVKFAQKTSEFDDVVRGIDLYFDIGDGETLMPIGLDVTTTSDPEKLQKKVDWSVDVVSRGDLPVVKYFYNELEKDNPNPKKKYLGNIEMPRLIIHFSVDETVKLQGDILNLSDNLEGDFGNLILEDMYGQLINLQKLAPRNSRISKILSKYVEKMGEFCKEKDLPLNDLQ